MGLEKGDNFLSPMTKALIPTENRKWKVITQKPD